MRGKLEKVGGLYIAGKWRLGGIRAAIELSCFEHSGWGPLCEARWARDSFPPDQMI